MITWIQLILQKHHKYVFSVLLFFIIIAFVFTIGSSIPFFGDRNRDFETNNQDFYGWNLKDQNVLQHLYMGTFYSLLLAKQQASDEQMQNAMFPRALLLSMAREMNLPKVSQSEYVEFIHTQPAFLGSDGEFSNDLFNVFVVQYSSRIGEALLNELLLENALVAKMAKILTGAGFVQDSQVDSLYNSQYSNYTFSVASLELSNFNPEIIMDEAKIVEFYEANKVRYQVGEEISLQVAFFPVSDFADAEISVTDSQLEAFYKANKASFEGDFSAAKEKVEAEYKKAQIKRLAMEKAQYVSDLVYDADTTFNSDAFKAIIASEKLSLKQVPAYKATDQNFPKDYPAEIIRAGLTLDSANWLYNEIVATDDGAYVVFLDAIKPSFVPSLTEIRIQIERDFKAAQTYELFTAKASALETSLADAIKENKSFAETAKAQGAKVDDFKDFSFVKPDENQLKALQTIPSVWEDLMYLKQGEISSMAISNGKAYIFFLSNLEKPTIDKNSIEYKSLAKRMSIMSATDSASALVSEKERAFDAKQLAK